MDIDRKNRWGAFEIIENSVNPTIVRLGWVGNQEVTTDGPSHEESIFSSIKGKTLQLIGRLRFWRV